MQKIERRAAAGLFLRLFGHAANGLRLDQSAIEVLAFRNERIPFQDIAGLDGPKNFLWFCGLVISLTNGSQIEVFGLKLADTRAFIEAARRAWQGHVAETLRRTQPELQTLAQAIERLSAPRRYPAACLLDPYVARSAAVFAAIPTSIPSDFASAEQLRMLATVLAFQKDPVSKRAMAIDAFIDAELREMKAFFDRIESNPLTLEQRRAVVTDEDATLVLAGAGSGKTSVIVAKAAYLIHQNIRKPDEILLLAFGAKAAEEMSNRIEERTGRSVEARTFHALGYSIINAVEGQAPALAPHTSDDSQFRILLRDILVEQITRFGKVGQLLLKWFSGFFTPYKNEWQFKTRDEYYRYVEAQELRTFNGELVKSFEECEIANWLYLNGISYEYEPIYEHELPENDRRTYTPDFRLTESGVYLEHFGVRKELASDGSVRLVTAPHVDRNEYLEGMEWKRQVHKDHGTTLIESYSYEKIEDRLTEALEEKLAPYATPSPIPTEQVLTKLSALGWIDSFTLILGTFLRHFKSSGITIEECRKRNDKIDDRRRGAAFLTIFESVFTSYQQRMGERIDFEDMIARATKYVESGRYRSPYLHLLVDEFQDISEGRAKLLRALKAQHPETRLFAVGDDWQSIYRFTGSDIHLMRHFGDEFGGTFAGTNGIHRSVDLGRTFRSVDRIALPARRFVLQNPNQLEKEVIPAGTTDRPALTIANYAPGQEDTTLSTILSEIAAMAPWNRKKSQTVLLLGRYRFVCPGNLESLQASYPKLAIRFMTIHGSKGLEADHVIILRAVRDRMGLPSEIVDDPLLDLVLPEPEKLDHAEERRLFYVALTRARHSVTILADQEKPSVFVSELAEDKSYGAVMRGGLTVADRRCPACGGRMLARTMSDSRVRFYCEHKHLCGSSLPACEFCNKDLPRAEGAPPGLKRCSCTRLHTSCPACDGGWLVKRKGPYSTFLGCVRYPDCRGTKKLGSR